MTDPVQTTETAKEHIENAFKHALTVFEGDAERAWKYLTAHLDSLFDKKQAETTPAQIAAEDDTKGEAA